MRITPQIHRYLTRADDDLAAFMKAHRLSTLPRPTHSPYDSLLQSIISQQISTQAARAIRNRFLCLFDEGVDYQRLTLMPDETLREVGLSRQKIRYIRDMAHRVSSGSLPNPEDLYQMSDAEIVEALVPIMGVGVWTVQMLLIFHFHRPDVWPVGDLGVKRGFMRVHRRRKYPDEKALEKYGNRFAPYRSFAARYYWLAASNP